MRSEVNRGSPASLSAEIAGRRQIRFAFGAVLVSAAFFLAVAPFATRALTPVPAFIPAYESALVICDLITAVLLLGQFSFTRSRALYALAGGYLFTACITVVHALTFPGLFSPTGLLGAGSQSTGWLYMFWHGGFPLFVIGYALLEDEGRKAGAASPAQLGAPGEVGIAIFAGIAVVVVLVGALTLVATAHGEILPVMLVNNRFTPAMTAIVSGVWVLIFAALAVLLRRRPYTKLDLWLMVVICAWLFDVALAAVLNAARFDVGWYAGRIYGLVAASFLLIVLLIENGRHYARLVQASEQLGAANAALELLSMQDGLTGLANRRFFDSYLDAQIAVARRYKRPLALVLCDVDAFKSYNDHYGHQAGDECLKRVAIALRSCCRRPADVAARYGGEEFAMILPDTELAGAAQIAEAVRDAVCRLEIAHEHSSAASHVSVSGGVAVLLRKIDITAQQLIMAADRTLFEAKHLGRNRMICVAAEAA